MQFTPVIKESVSIFKTLQEFSKVRDIDVKLLDFELVSYKTYMKKEEFGEYEKIDDFASITQEECLNPTVEFAQEYTIKIIPFNAEKSSAPFKLSLSANKLKTRISVTISKGSVFQKDQNLLKNLKSIIWYKKLRSNIFIGLFEKSLNLQLKKLLKVLPIGKKLSKDVKFSVGVGVDPVAPLDAKVEKVYEEKNKNKSLIEGVDKDELVLKFHKAQKGENGRSCSGRFIKVREPRNSKLKPKIDETIYIKESEMMIEYFANKNGFVLFQNGNLSISQTLSISGADFKSTGNIDAGDRDKDISVHIKHQKSQSDDAIGSGVSIDVKNLDVDGSIGSNVNITTNELNVDAQTHKNSKIEVQNNANIQLHRGDLKAANAEINILETGKVTATESIHVKKMLGGEAIAPIVRVDELLSNSTIIASELIEIKTLHGENCSLIIDPLSIESYHEKLDLVRKKLQHKEEEIERFKESLAFDLQSHSELLPRIQTFQMRVQKAIKAKKAPMKQDVLRVKTYKKAAAKLQERSEELKIKEGELQEIKEELLQLEEYDLHAKVILHTRYNGQTKVIFVDVKTEEKLMKIPEGVVKTISLSLNKENERTLVFENN